MSKVQLSPIAPPSNSDRDTLKDYTSKIQEGFDALFQDAHDHGIRTQDPSSEEGQIGDIIPIDDGTNKYLVIRYSDGWYKTSNLTAL